MGLLEQAREDNAQITSNENDFAVPIEMIAPTEQIAIFNCSHIKHHTAVDDLGQRTNSKTASVTINESVLLIANPNYPIRLTSGDHSGEVDLRGHLVNAPDSTGEIKKYVVKSWYPNETIGSIVIILNDYSPE